MHMNLLAIFALMILIIMVPGIANYVILMFALTVDPQSESNDLWQKIVLLFIIIKSKIQKKYKYKNCIIFFA